MTTTRQRIELVGKQFEEHGYVDHSLFALDPEILLAQPPSQEVTLGSGVESVESTDTAEHTGRPGHAGTAPSVVLRCRLCRRRVATDLNIVTHGLGKGQTSFQYNKRNQPYAANGANNMPAATHHHNYTADQSTSVTAQYLLNSACTSIFVEPIQWMSSELDAGAMEGKLSCPNAKCESRLGSYNWWGMQCSCGAWVTPALQIHKNKVDIIDTRVNVLATKTVSAPAPVPSEQPATPATEIVDT